MLKEERKLQKRHIAHKVRIKDILDSDYKRVEGFDSNYLEVGRKEIARVNVVGVVVQKPDTERYRSLIIDDGTGQISARSFESNNLLERLNIGDFILLIGKPREFSGEKYIFIEIIKRIDGRWAKVRAKELSRGLELNVNREVLNEISEDDRSEKKAVVKMIKDMDKGRGVAVEDIQLEGDVDKIVGVLLKEGDIFEVKPGILKVLE